MTENYYTHGSHSDHSTFGGLIYDYDYNGYTPMSAVADRIISDWKFDKWCEISAKQRERSQKINRQYENLHNQ